MKHLAERLRRKTVGSALAFHILSVIIENSCDYHSLSLYLVTWRIVVLTSSHILLLTYTFDLSLKCAYSDYEWILTVSNAKAVFLPS